MFLTDKDVDHYKNTIMRAVSRIDFLLAECERVQQDLEQEFLNAPFGERTPQYAKKQEQIALMLEEARRLRAALDLAVEN